MNEFSLNDATDHASSPTSPLSFGHKRHGKLVAPSPKKAFYHKWLPAKGNEAVTFMSFRQIWIVK